MHQGQLAGPPNPVDHSFNNLPNAQQKAPENVAPPGAPGAFASSQSEHTPAPNANASSLDDLVSGAAKDADNAAATADTKTEAPKPKEAQEEKKGKKEKDKSMKLIYSDNEVSPEEKMAKMPRYAFAPTA